VPQLASLTGNILSASDFPAHDLESRVETSVLTLLHRIRKLHKRLKSPRAKEQILELLDNFGRHRFTSGPLVSQHASHPIVGKRTINVGVWLGGLTSDDEPARLQLALNEFLGDLDVELLEASPPQFGSLFQTFRFVGRMGDYTRRLMANLNTAFGTAAQSQKFDNVEKLSKILKAHSHVVLHIDNVFAAKITRNRQTYVCIRELPPHLAHQIAAQPALLLKDAEALYTILTEGAASPTTEDNPPVKSSARS
jgi:hypothetical protein